MVVYLRKSYRWSVSIFLENYVTAKYSAGSNTKSHKQRAKKLSAAIFSNLAFKKALLPFKNTKLLKLHFKPLQKKIEEELELLIQDKVRNKEKKNKKINRRRLRIFNAMEPVKDIKLNLLVKTI